MVRRVRVSAGRALGRLPEALEAYGKALEMSQLEPEMPLSAAAHSGSEK
jgi:hypothetical protein